MSGAKKKEPVVTVAIDFGTTYSGYAYSFAGAHGAIFMSTNWISQAGLITYKTPTCVLTEYTRSTRKHKFLKFGYTAQDDYVNGAKNENICLFDKFKMKLHKIEEKGGSMKMWDKRNKTSADASTIFAMALRYIKDHLMEHFVESGKNIKTDFIGWVLTVPAIWSESAKGFMRKAAVQGGLINTEESDDLLIVLEPEAASLYCRGLDMKHFENESAGDELSMPEGTIYMLIDAGGGTVDITVQEVISSGNVKEVLSASGKAVGGTNVDAKFKQILKKIWGEDFIKTLQEECSIHWLNIEHSFEKAKRTASPSLTQNYNIFSVSMAVDRKYREKTGGNILDSSEDSRSLGVLLDKDEATLTLTDAAMQAVFQPTLNAIVKCVREVMQQTPKIKYIFMVGGLGSSHYLTKVIRNNFGRKAKVLVPEEPALAVLRGAVQFGLRPDYVRTRIARKTYGVDYEPKFDPLKHDIKRKFIKNGKEHCNDCLDVFVKKNSAIDLDSSVVKTYKPLNESTTEFPFNFYSSDLENPIYVDDIDTQKIGYLSVPSPDTSKGRDRRFDVTFYFGGTEIRVTVKERGVSDALEKTTRISFVAS